MKKIILLLLGIFLFFGCGFKPVNLNTNFKISEINTTGDQRLNYKIKNKLLISESKDNELIIEISLNTNKNKVIKEKNISNEITKYEINIITQVEYRATKGGDLKAFTVTKNGSYEVSSRHSDTLSNEKSLEESLINEVSDEIIERLIAFTNDL